MPNGTDLCLTNPHAKKANKFTEKNPLFKKQNEEGIKSMTKTEYLDLKVKMEDVYMLRTEIVMAIEDIKRFRETGYAELSGRARLMDTVLNAGVKLLEMGGVNFFRAYHLLRCKEDHY